jgi:cell division protein FtsB
MKLDVYLSQNRNINSNWIKNKQVNMKLLEGNKGEMLQGIGLAKIFLDMTTNG